MRGPIGQKGIKGDTSVIGIKGDKGDPGNLGPSGEKGMKGDIGMNGNNGEKGDYGGENVKRLNQHRVNRFLSFGIKIQKFSTSFCEILFCGRC